MKNSRLLHFAGVAGALVLSSPALASYVGLVVTTESPGPGPAPPGGPFTIYHVYAEFTNTLERVNRWGSGPDPDLGSALIQNVLADGVTLGSGFVQVGGAAGQLAPPSPGYPRDWDTYMTIGVRWGLEAPGGIDATSLMPGTPTFIAGTTWGAPASNAAGAYITPGDHQGMAGYRVNGNDTPFRVLLMQLVVHQGEHVRGTIGIHWSMDGIITYSVATGQTFNSIPGPGGLPALSVAALLVGRRRRRD